MRMREVRHLLLRHRPLLRVVLMRKVLIHSRRRLLLREVLMRKVLIHKMQRLLLLLRRLLLLLHQLLQLLRLLLLRLLQGVSCHPLNSLRGATWLLLLRVLLVDLLLWLLPWRRLLGSLRGILWLLLRLLLLCWLLLLL